MIVVLDTNIWVSALIFDKNYGPPVKALEKAMQQDVIATAEELESEIFRTFTVKFRWPPEKALASIKSVLQQSLRVTLTHTTKVCRDPKDNMFLECAALARADYLVAGDKDLLVLGSYAGTRIITPFEYISLNP